MKLTDRDLLDLIDRIDNLIFIIQKTEGSFHLIERLLDIRNILIKK
jgi:hypothetical protein